jgi:16S rRNA C967 or C1407 C5-methylase (RsmB/RsmF family)
MRLHGAIELMHLIEHFRNIKQKGDIIDACAAPGNKTIQV